MSEVERGEKKVCEHYTVTEVSKGFPLKQCSECPSNKYDDELGFMFCQKVSKCM